jgi:hypothetical protein
MALSPVHPPPLPAVDVQSRAKWRAGAVLLLFVAAGVFLYVVDPRTARYVPECPSRLAGVYCPGCGTLRATHALLHGRLGQAVSLNPLYLIALPVLGFALIRQGWRIARDQPAPPIGSGLRPAWIWGLFVLICVYSIARNLPWFPFTLLGPRG